MTADDKSAADDASAGETFKAGDAVIFSGRDGERAERTTTFAAGVLKVLDNGQYVIRNVLKTKNSSMVVDPERLEPAPHNINPMNEMYSSSSRGDIGGRSRRNQELLLERSARVAVEAENKKLQQQIGEEQQQRRKAKAQAEASKKEAIQFEQMAVDAEKLRDAHEARVNKNAEEAMNGALGRNEELQFQLDAA
ncbi:MAG: hypothetical protein VXV86_04150, partial [Verrucomicrobiota bacterium]|nr:hypothetical protein [Verrucomicrobiota bacterium]